MNILHNLGIDPEDVDWADLAACRSARPQLFDSDYEHDPAIRPAVDALCASCPVRKECLTAGVENKRYYVWGGLYLKNGRPDQDMNAHKSEEDWQDIRRLLSE